MPDAAAQLNRWRAIWSKTMGFSRRILSQRSLGGAGLGILAAGLFVGLALVPVPGGWVNAAARNLLVRWEALSIDTRLGTHTISATYNSATASWLWSFDASYDGAEFLDDTGARFETAALAPGDALPGTHWVIVDAQRIKTKGGLVHEFDGDGNCRVNTQECGEKQGKKRLPHRAKAT